jgi:hypothetical protein
VSESYPSETDPSTPALPELPRQEPARFQFSLKQLLAYMVASAFLAALLRLALQWLQSLPQPDVNGLPAGLLPQPSWIGLPHMILAGLIFGGLLYFFLRVPFLIHHHGRIRRRLQAMKEHRQDLADWAEQRRQPKSNESGEPSARQ